MTDTPPPVPPADDTTPPASAPTPPPAAPAYGQPASYGPATNTLAIVAMVLSLAGIITGITAVVGAILGHVALGQIKRTGEGGRPFALTAVIVGWVLTGLGLLFLVIGIVVWVFAFASYSAYY